MRSEHVRGFKHLSIEKLEGRALLDGMAFFDVNTTLDPYNLQPGSGTMIGGGFPNQTPAIPVTSMGDFSPLAGFGFGSNANLMPNTGSLGTIGLGRTGATVVGNVIRGVNDAGDLNDPRGDFAMAAPSADSGTGQMTITTGANTPGIGSFATSTNGINSESGGTGRVGGRAAQRDSTEKGLGEPDSDAFDSTPGNSSGGTTKTSSVEGGE